MRLLTPSRNAALLLLSALASCVRPQHIAPLALMPFEVDTLHADRVSDGVVHRYVYSITGPWAIHLLDVDLRRCTTILALKGADSAAGRIKTSDILARAAKDHHIVAGVNADFFSLANGTPTNLLVVDGTPLTRPSAGRPVFSMDSGGAPHIGFFAANGSAITPFHPLEAVGGRPIIVRDSAIVAGVDTIGGASFATSRHPRTAVGVVDGGKRLVFAVVDGRQAPYSDGMSLREVGRLMLALGARDALNLDGGGSTTMLFADPARGGALRIANRPSDKEGERAVGDAIGIAAECGRR